MLKAPIDSKIFKSLLGSAVSDVDKFKNHYPSWKLTYTVVDMLKEIYTANISRWV
jgi:hypothetical protein